MHTSLHRSAWRRRMRTLRHTQHWRQHKSTACTVATDLCCHACCVTTLLQRSTHFSSPEDCTTSKSSACSAKTTSACTAGHRRPGDEESDKRGRTR